MLWLIKEGILWHEWHIYWKWLSRYLLIWHIVFCMIKCHMIRASHLSSMTIQEVPYCILRQSVCMTQPRSEPFWICYIQSISTEEVHENTFHQMMDYYISTRVCHFPTLVLWGSLDNDLATVFMRNNYQFSWFLSGACSQANSAWPGKMFNRINEQLQAGLRWCFRRPNKCSIRALIGSRNHSVTSAAESSLSTEWWVIGRDLQKKMISITRGYFCCWFY